MGQSSLLGLLEVFGLPSLLLTPLLYFLVMGPLLLYPIARWKAQREQVLDPQLGLKLALCYFALIAFQLVLFAITFILFTIFSKDDDKSSMFRAGFALLVPGGVVLAAHVMLLQRTNQFQYPIVRRLFLGYNLVLTGLAGLASLIVAFQVLFSKGSSGDVGRMGIAALLVYLTAWVTCGIHFGRAVLGDSSSDSAAPPHNIVPPSAANQSGGPTLPSLSAGSFPPIDKK